MEEKEQLECACCHVGQPCKCCQIHNISHATIASMAEISADAWTLEMCPHMNYMKGCTHCRRGYLAGWRECEDAHGITIN